MIDLSIDLSYLSRYYGISAISSYMQPVQNVQGGEKDGMLTIVTEDGMITVNAELLQKLLKEPEKLAKVMKLADPENRYLIIRELNEEDLVALLPFLTSEQLSYGLQYFTPDGIENCLINLPQEQLLTLLLEKFTMEDVTPFMQTNEMDEFFKNPHLDRNDVMKYFKGLEYEKFQALMMNQFGAEYKNKSADEYLEEIGAMEDKEYHRFLYNMQKFEKAEMLAGLCKIEPDYYTEFENDILVRPIMQTMEKADIIKSMSTLEPEFLMPMIQELPKDLIQVITTQIDPAQFSEILASEFPDLLMEMLAGK